MAGELRARAGLGQRDVRDIQRRVEGEQDGVTTYFNQGRGAVRQ